MIYSKWKPSKGGYDYYEAKEQDVPLGNDLPVPLLPRGTDIGVASVVCGRPMPSGAKYVGSGPEAAGLISPTESGILGSVTSSVPMTYLQVAFGVFLGWLVFKKKVLQ